MKKTKNKELRELIKSGTALLQNIKALDKDIEKCTDLLVKHELIQAKSSLQKEFNEVFDKVFDNYSTK